MNDSPITKRPPNIAFRPVRIESSDHADWVIKDIRIGNRSQIDHRWYVRIWQRLAWRWDRLLVRLKLRKPPKTRLINEDRR